MSITSLFGSSSSTDRSAQLAGFGELESLFTSLFAQGGSLGKAGASDTGAASSYWRSILGGRTGATQANAPAINAGLNQADASKKQLAATGTGRGGGTASTSATIDDKTRSMIDNLIASGRSDAAGSLGNLGSTELSQMLSAFSTAGSGSANLASLAGTSRQADLQNQSQIGQSVGELAMLALMM